MQALEQFFWNDLCDNYLELIKDLLFKPEKYSAEEVAATKATLHDVMLRVLQLFAPYVPHITEIIYQELYQKQVGAASLHLTKFSDLQKPHTYTESAEAVNHLITVVSAVRKLKSDHAVSLKTELKECVIVAQQKMLDAIKPLEVVLKGVVNAQHIVYSTTSTGSSYLQERDGAWYATACLDEL